MTDRDERDELAKVLSEHLATVFDLGTPREYTQFGGWNVSCGCGGYLCSHPDACDCHALHLADVLLELANLEDS